MKHPAYLALLLVIISSCSTHKRSISKFIFIAGQDIVYDSLENPQLSIRNYFEFVSNSEIKIATGHRYYDSIAPAFGLDSFYKADFDPNFARSLDITFIGRNYNTDYYEGKTYWYYFFLVVSNDSMKATISFNDPKLLPKELCNLYLQISNFSGSHKIYHLKKFTVDKAVTILQDSLFKRFPPPPPLPKELKRLPVKYPRARE
jgi:hypothetical protein